MNFGVKSRESCIEILRKQGWNLQSSCKFVMDRKRHKSNDHTNWTIMKIKIIGRLLTLLFI